MIKNYLFCISLIIIFSIYQNISSARIYKSDTTTDRSGTLSKAWHSIFGDKKQDEEDLRIYARSGILSAVKNLINSGVDVNAKDDRGTALAEATSNGHKDIVEFLLRSGANIDATDLWGMPSLYWAIANGHIAIAELLINSGANINIPDHLGRTALMEAAHIGRLDIIPLLLKLGTNLEAKGRYGMTALLLAAEASLPAAKTRHDIIKLLIDAGVNVNATDTAGRTALILASKSHYNKDIVKSLLLANIDFDMVDQYGKKALDYAKEISTFDRDEIRKDKAEIIKILEEAAQARRGIIKKTLTEENIPPVLSDIVVDYSVRR